MLNSLIITVAAALVLSFVYGYFFRVGMIGLLDGQDQDGQLMLESYRPRYNSWKYILAHMLRLAFMGAALYVLLLFTAINLILFTVLFLCFFITHNFLILLRGRMR